MTGEAGLELRRAAGERLEEGEALRWLSEILWCPGRTLEAERMARDSVALLETLPEGPALASAYTVLGNHCGTAGGRRRRSRGPETDSRSHTGSATRRGRSRRAG